MTDTELTPEDAQAEIDTIKGDPDGPYWKSGTRQHDEAVDRVSNLYSAIHGDGPAILSSPNGEISPDLESLIAPEFEPPDTPDGYNMEAFAMPDGVEFDHDVADQFREVFHRADLGQAEVDQLLTIASSDVEIDQAHTEAVLASRYRGDAEGMQRDIDAARSAIRRVGGQPLVDWINETGMGNSLQLFDLALRKSREMGL